MSLCLAPAEASAELPVHYPTRLIDARRLCGGQSLLRRPVLPQDDALLAAMLWAQPAQALRWRFHGAVRPSTGWCQRMSRVDYRQQLAMVVCAVGRSDEHLVAEARYSLADDDASADCALMVDTRWHRRGLGRWLLGALLWAAADAGLERLECEVLADNQAMLGLAQSCGFKPLTVAQEGRLLRLQRGLGDARVHGRHAIR